MHPPYVALVGPAQPEADDLIELARRAGALLAGRGYIVLTGGLSGVMAAAAAGVTSVGGTAVALLPGDDRAAASPGHAIVIPTGMGEMRNALIVRAADAVLAVGGSWGTLSEMALAARTGTPVFAVRSWELPPPEVVGCVDVEDAVARIAAAMEAWESGTI